jgi:MoxR-like ATPase
VGRAHPPDGRQQEDQTLRQVTDASTLLAMQAAVERVTVDESVGRYCVALATATRTHPHVLMGASPRGALGLLLASRAFAIIAGRDYVTPRTSRRWPSRSSPTASRSSRRCG